jgi:rhodanese-related sulfurtransferase
MGDSRTRLILGTQPELGGFRQASGVEHLPEISREALWEKIERGDAFVLVDALAPMSFAHSHLPGAINLPPEWVDERGPRRIPDSNAEIVVYCASETCDSSVEVGKRLVELGYRNVRHYVGGKKDWIEGGLPVEGGGVRSR